MIFLASTKNATKSDLFVYVTIFLKITEKLRCLLRVTFKRSLSVIYSGVVTTGTTFILQGPSTITK